MSINLFSGPHFIGAIMLLAGLLMKFFPPKNINGLYGYRTPRSKQNQRNWDEANSYAANLMIKLSVTAIVLGILLSWIMPPKQAAIMHAASIISLVVITIVLMAATERHLKNLPDQNPE